LLPPAVEDWRSKQVDIDSQHYPCTAQMEWKLVCLGLSLRRMPYA
jgi:hypothetical protein